MKLLKYSRFRAVLTRENGKNVLVSGQLAVFPRLFTLVG